MELTRDEKLQLFGEGPWLDEPDRERFEHAGLPCLLRRNEHLGHWCGYVAVPPGHPLHGQEAMSDAAEKLSAHGGVTYAAECFGDESHGICHVPKPGEPDNVWWLGFDCGHCFDLSPFSNQANKLYGLLGLPKIERMYRQEEYRDIDYVREEVRGLAEQLCAMVASGA